MIEIDGGIGEGGGQILRTALSLSCYFEKSIRIFNIRAKRKNPGLQPQHLACVKAAQLISGAEVKGDSLGSLELLFTPGKVKGGFYRFDIGTAGSASLVLQTVLLPLCFTDDESQVIITGGTHVPWSPPFHYLRDVFLLLLEKLGIHAEIHLERAGFYPKGGGIIKALIKPVSSVSSIVIEDRGSLKTLHAISAVGNLPMSIAQRQKNGAFEALKAYGFDAEAEVISISCIGQGTFFFILGEFEHSIAGFSSIGERGKRAEEVGREAAEEFIKFHLSGASLDKRLADQIVPYLALSNSRSSFTTSEVTEHLLTNIEVIKKFTDADIKIEAGTGRTGRVSIAPDIKL
ncbi:MAG: RNA 3'-phosphate cyclase [Nitrospirae bacterium]|nr:RNA 3'-phosphate cyclase [Nitrospirota bacterium]